MSNTEDENRFISERRSKLKALVELDGERYPNHYRPNDLCSKVQKSYKDMTKSELLISNIHVSLAGRVVSSRSAFIVIKDDTGDIQFYFNQKDKSLEKVFARRNLLDLGDIVYGDGKLERSGKGDLYVCLENFFILSKCLRPLPDNYYGFSDIESRYRKRYVDLIANDQSLKVFKHRFLMIKYVRTFLENALFLEVETPMMHPIPGGATARPFVTHHNSLDKDLYLRIAPELYLKRLLVGGFSRVFEINRSFRNEGLSPKHNPEFTMLEFYATYQTYEDFMDLIEQLIQFVVSQLYSSRKIEYKNYIIDFSTPFKRMTIQESIIDFLNVNTDQIDNKSFLSELAEKNQLEINSEDSVATIQFLLFEKLVEPLLQEPVFITGYARSVSPLARSNDEDSSIVDRFELFIMGIEIANGFSELNDPEDQAKRFQDQLDKKVSGDLEAMHYDADYIEALEVGMPPAAGAGIGLDRLAMLLTDQASIKDVILFPQMK